MKFRNIALALLATASLLATAGCRHRCNSTRESSAAVDCCRE